MSNRINFTDEQLNDIKYLYTEQHLSMKEIGLKYNKLAELKLES